MRHVGMDAALEVAVAGEHRRDREVARRRSPSRSRARAGRSCRCTWCSRSRRRRSRARQRRHEPGLLVVVGDDERTRRERRLHPRRRREPARHGVPREEPGRDHHRRVRRVRARRDRRDHDRAVGEVERAAVGERDRRLLAAASVAPSSRRTPRERARAKPAFAPEQRHAVLRARAGAGRATARPSARSSSSRLVVLRDGGRVVPEALLLRVRLDERDEVVGAAGRAQVAQRLVVDREQRARRAVLGRHVADRRPVLERDAADTLAVELDELADDAVPAQHLRDGEHEVGGGDTRRAARRRA